MDITTNKSDFFTDTTPYTSEFFMDTTASTREVLDQIIRIWRMRKSDFLGYELEKGDTFSYHHTRVPKRYGGPTSIENGSALCKNTSHPYLHVIERYDKDLFLYITKILIEVNDQVYLPTHDQLVRIDEALSGFEREHSSDVNKKGHYLIKDSYTRRLIRKTDYFI